MNGVICRNKNEVKGLLIFILDQSNTFPVDHNFVIEKG